MAQSDRSLRNTWQSKRQGQRNAEPYIMTRIVWEDGSVAGGEVESTGVGAAQKHSCAGVALSEVEPLLSL